jgi:hypothetical protein
LKNYVNIDSLILEKRMIELKKPKKKKKIGWVD